MCLRRSIRTAARSRLGAWSFVAPSVATTAAGDLILGFFATRSNRTIRPPAEMESCYDEGWVDRRWGLDEEGASYIHSRGTQGRHGRRGSTWICSEQRARATCGLASRPPASSTTSASSASAASSAASSAAPTTSAAAAASFHRHRLLLRRLLRLPTAGAAAASSATATATSACTSPTSAASSASAAASATAWCVYEDASSRRRPQCIPLYARLR